MYFLSFSKRNDFFVPNNPEMRISFPRQVCSAHPSLFKIRSGGGKKLSLLHPSFLSFSQTFRLFLSKNIPRLGSTVQVIGELTGDLSRKKLPKMAIIAKNEGNGVCAHFCIFFSLSRSVVRPRGGMEKNNTRQKDCCNVIQEGLFRRGLISLLLSFDEKEWRKK